MNLRDPASIEAGVAKIGGKVDALFICAGLPQTFPPLEVKKVNILGTRALTDAVLNLMAERGAIASIASTGGLGWSRRLPVHMEFLASADFAAGLAWFESHLDQVAEYPPSTKSV